jgi:basic amino acid/polyamine antiporter, APA family
VAIGNTIGSGILRTPGDVARLLPSAGLFILVWIVGAGYAFLGANAFAELATMIPESGGHTVFARRAFGQYAGFVIGWSDWLSTCGSIALASLVIGESAKVFIGLNPPATATIVIVGLALIHLRGVKTAGRAQELTAVAKTVAFGVLVIACFATSSSTVGGVPLLAGAARPGLLTALVLAMQAVIFTYDGYYGVVYFSGEVKNPARDIPRSIFGGVLAVAAIYIFLNLGFIRVLTIPRMAGDPLVAATAAGQIFGSAGDTVIRVLTIVSLLSAVNAFELMASRVLYRLGTRGFVPKAEIVNEGGTPTVSLLITTALTLALVLTGTFETVLALTAFFFVAQYAVDFAGLLVLRAREPDAPRPFKAWGHPWTTWGVLAVSIVFLIGAVAGDTRNSLYSIGLLVLSWPIYRLVARQVTL